MKNKLLYIFLILGVATYSQQSYYNDVNLNLTGIALKDALATKIINTHTRTLSYSQIWGACKATDVNPTNSSEVLLVYGWENGTDGDVTNDRERGINNNGGSNGDWNREHVYPRSLGTPNLGDSGPGADAHHLRPSDVQRNSSRGNKKFASGSGVNSSSTNGGWYPGNEWKGDVARMMMYMYLRYGSRCLPSNVGIGNSSSTPDDMIDLFLQWNADDPVSDIEKQRNTYHENTSNPDAQGNRNPFIDNPRLATRIWGGPEAEDIWGIYTNNDTQAPSVPSNVSLSNITTNTIKVNWNASSDNVGVTSYNVFVDGNLYQNTTSTSITVSSLNSNTQYAFSVSAKDAADNESAKSTPVNGTTLQDTQAPTVPTNINISNETGTSFIVSWSASSDNTAVTGYEIYLDGNLNSTTDQITYTVTGLSNSTTYSVQILAKDAVNNKSALSTAVNATTTDGSTTTANELFFSEYVEGSSNNKALEIANETTSDINLSSYSIKRQKNGGVDGDDWEHELTLSGTLLKGDVYVIINGSASLQQLIDEADFTQPNNNSTNFGAPINFNGNDPVGLFKNGVLIDIIGTYNGGSSNFAANKTLRRKSDVAGPNSVFDLTNEWDEFPSNTVDNIGQHNSTLNTNSYLLNKINMYPNPIKGNKLHFNLSKNLNVEIYSILGKLILSKEVLSSEKYIDVSNLNNGIYLIKIKFDEITFTKKIVKN